MQSKKRRKEDRGRDNSDEIDWIIEALEKIAEKLKVDL